MGFGSFLVGWGGFRDGGNGGKRAEGSAVGFSDITEVIAV